MLITLLVFLVILGILVFVHELGHFLVAKKSGVRVEEFAFGFRPRLMAKKFGDTTYAINLIPLGGYVKMYGEADNETGQGSFKSIRPLPKLAILAAGSVMNLLLAVVILTVLFVVGFEPIFPNASTNPFINQKPVVTVGQVLPDSPAAATGFQSGDQLLTVGDTKITSSEQFVSTINLERGREVIVGLFRNHQPLTIKVTPRADPTVGQGALGVAVGETGVIRSSVLLAPLAAVYETGRIIGLSVAGFVGFIKELIVKQHVSDQVTGLVGVGALTGVARRLGFAYLAELVALISVSLGAINLMPILPLDGGHIAVLLYEKISRRSLTERQFTYFAGAGLGFIILLFVVVTIKDVIRFNVFGRLF